MTTPIRPRVNEARPQFGLCRPRIELVRLRKIDFFPPRPSQEALASGEPLCIGTKSRNLGDALALTTLPRKLHGLHPSLRIETYVRGFNPIVFYGNPHVSGVRYLPRAVHGDDANWGSGQQIHLKEQWLDLNLSPAPRPELFLTAKEIAWADSMLERHRLPENAQKPLCVIHPWGSTHSKVAPVEFWDRLVKRWSPHVRFWQVGVIGHGAIQGCEYYFLLPRRLEKVRRLFAIMSRARAFVGVDSGPMHVARAFNVPSLVALTLADPARAFEARRRWPHFLHGNWRNVTLYEENTHLGLGSVAGARASGGQIDDFFEKVARRAR